MVASIPNDVFQFSTHAALTAGFNTGQPRTADLTSHGTDGIGVYEDGSRMILVDRKAHALRTDGTVVPAPMNARLPFAMVTIYQPTYRIQLPSLTLEELEDVVSSSELGPAKGTNTLMPFKITGDFASVTLEDSSQISTSKGTIFGFVVPKWMREISGPRIHAHFVEESGKIGGLVSDFDISEGVTLGFAKCGRFHLGFPQGLEWEDVRL
jgi:alpha-acetolactate decarboxylase